MIGYPAVRGQLNQQMDVVLVAADATDRCPGPSGNPCYVLKEPRTYGVCEPAFAVLRAEDDVVEVPTERMPHVGPAFCSSAPVPPAAPPGPGLWPVCRRPAGAPFLCALEYHRLTPVAARSAARCAG